MVKSLHQIKILKMLRLKHQTIRILIMLKKI